MNVITQWVRTTWTANSRGGPGAARRNAAPLAFRLPELTGSPCLHEVTMAEADGFVPRSALSEALPPPGRVDLREEDGLLRVAVMPDPWGHPPQRRRPPALRLAPGQWVRWRINHRTAPGCCGDERTYHLDTVNLAYGLARPELFLGEPTREVDERVRLF